MTPPPRDNPPRSPQDRPPDGRDETALVAPGGKVDRDALLERYASLEEAGDDQPVTVTFTLGRDLCKRLDRYLVDRVPFLSRTSIQRLIEEGAVEVNGRTGKASTRLRVGDVVVAILPPVPSSEIPAENIPIEVIHEDADLIVINKQADIIVHPARGNKTGTLVNALAWHFRAAGSGSLSRVGEENARPGIVHRLDRHTTGVMVAAKSDTAHWRLGRQFEQRRTDKRYLAVVHGRIDAPADTIDLPLGKHPTVRERYAVRWDESGKPAVTIYRVRELYAAHTLVELELRTGRTHQIRVHLSHLGYPIVGDDLYGGRPIAADELGEDPPPEGEARRWIIRRQALHATTLGFTHPISGERLRFQAPLPDDMRRLVHALRHAGGWQRLNVPGAGIDLDEVT